MVLNELLCGGVSPCSRGSCNFLNLPKNIHVYEKYTTNTAKLDENTQNITIGQRLL